MVMKGTKIDFSNPGHLKLCLLSEGIQITDSSIFEIEQFAENQFPYGYSNKFVKSFRKIPSELIFPNEVVAGLHINSKSPWFLTYDPKVKKIYLEHKNKKITEVWFNPKPLFYGKRLANGITSEKVAVMYGLYTLSFFTRGWCYFFVKNVQCKFCSLAPTRQDLGKGNTTAILSKMAEEGAKLAFKKDGKRIFYVNHCSGSHKNNNLGLTLQIQILQALKKIVPKRIKHHMLTMPPDDLTLLKDLKRANLGTLNFAIEVFDPALFKKICTGKQLYYGYDKFLQAYEEGVKIFGRGNMYANFVGGLEPLASMFKGFEYFAKRGIAPSINIFHPDPESEFAYKKPPSIDYIFELVKTQSDIYKKNKFVAIFPRGGTRNSLDTEVYRGFFN